MNPKIIYFTKEGYDLLQKEYEETVVSRPEAVSELAKARAMGDLSENGYYKSARMKLSSIDRRIRELKYRMQYGRVKQNTQTDTIDVGSVVTLSDGTSERTYTIVGTYEANPAEGKISFHSPLGRTLMEKRSGETAILMTPAAKVEYKILSVT